MKCPKCEAKVVGMGKGTKCPKCGMKMGGSKRWVCLMVFRSVGGRIVTGR